VESVFLHILATTTVGGVSSLRVAKWDAIQAAARETSVDFTDSDKGRKWAPIITNSERVT